MLPFCCFEEESLVTLSSVVLIHAVRKIHVMMIIIDTIDKESFGIMIVSIFIRYSSDP